jgi:endonuclease III
MTARGDGARPVLPRARARPAPRRDEPSIGEVIRRLRRTRTRWNPTALAVVAEETGDPFRVLIACILSLRTQDTTTGPAAARLFALADTPAALRRLITRARSSARSIRSASIGRRRG